MQFIPLDNFYAYMRGDTSKATNKTWYDTSGQIHTAFHANNNFVFHNGYTGTQTETGTGYCFFYAVSDETLNHDTYQITPVGTSANTPIASAGGYSTTVTITGNETATIRHLVAVRKVYYANSSTADAVLFALKLDTPVELNAENDYTANFTFAIEF